MISKLLSAYKIWRQYQRHIPTFERYSIGVKADSTFIEVIENAVAASILPKSEKLPYLSKAITKLELFKFFLTLMWEIKALDVKKLSTLIPLLEEIGRMLGGWKNQVIKQNSPIKKTGEK